MPAEDDPLHSLPPLRDVIRSHGLTARKSLGQNFLLDLNLTGAIARAAARAHGSLDELTVIEIGPGPGGLTRALLAEGAQRVIAIERDARCRPALDEITAAAGGRLTIVEADALAVDFADLAPNGAILVANLPYNIATPLLTGWISTQPWPPWYAGLTLMFQREVAERITAAPGTKSYGRLSVLCQWRCTCTIVMGLPARAFTPPPKVESAVVSFTPRPQPSPPCAVGDLEAVTLAAFGQRRKMLRASLKGLFPAPEVTLEKLGIAPTQRAETLSVAQFAELAAALRAQREREESL